LWAQHLDLWIKNPFAVSPRIQLTITADLRPQIRSPHTSARAVGTAAQAAAVAPNGTVPSRSARNAITVFWDAGL